MEQTTSYTDPWNPQAAPVDGLADATVMQWPVVAAVWLLAAWAPYGVPGWRATMTLDDDAEWDDAEIVPDVARLLAERIPVGDERGERLRDYLAQRLTGSYTELRRLPGDDLILLFRDDADGALRITVATATTVEPPPAGDDPGSTRLACVMTLLSDMLWVDSSNPVTFAAAVRPAPVVRPPDPELQWRPISEQEAWEALESTARMSLDELSDEWFGSPDDAWPPLPPGHLAEHLCRDLLDTLVERTHPTEILTGGYWPIVLGDEDEEEEEATICSIRLVGPQHTAILDIDFRTSE
ncbi:MAG TPA: hypothetical protein VL738_23635 [Dactylosporangium sp.]|nr:hypothetical protein [Dactylosporangium sp.]